MLDSTGLFRAAKVEKYRIKKLKTLKNLTNRPACSLPQATASVDTLAPNFAVMAELVETEETEPLRRLFVTLTKK